MYLYNDYPPLNTDVNLIYFQMVIENDIRNEDIERVRSSQGSVRKAIDSNSLIKLKLLLQGAPLGAEGHGYTRKGNVRVHKLRYSK